MDSLVTRHPKPSQVPAESPRTHCPIPHPVHTAPPSVYRWKALVQGNSFLIFLVEDGQGALVLEFRFNHTQKKGLSETMESSMPQHRVKPEIIKKKLPGVWKSTKLPSFFCLNSVKPDVDRYSRGKGYGEKFRQKLGTGRLVLSNFNVHRNHLGNLLTCKFWFSGSVLLISFKVMPCCLGHGLYFDRHLYQLQISLDSDSPWLYK